MNRRSLALGLGVLLTLWAVGWTTGTHAAVPQPKAPNAFQQLRAEEMKKFREFLQQMQKDNVPEDQAEPKMKEYGRGMVERYEKFRDSAQGSSYTLEANREIITIATQLLDDPKVVHATIAKEKNPEQALRLKLLAAEGFSDGEMPDEAKKMVEEVLAASKEKYPALYKQAEQTRFRVAPQGLPFPEFPEFAKDLDDKPIRIADYKGKVVMVDFWAAWCGPCMAEAPNVVATYNKWHPKGFEIIGISLDQSKDKMLEAVKKEGMTWRQYFDGLYWRNKVSTLYGINSIPATYLVGPDGKVVASNLRGEKLGAELEKLLGEKK